ncbi:hypothetical protein [Luteococcus sp. OSA5]|uniref:hypothetical protein n=1 Tax=Luteococcus sp. OSA5 TaxID=3401630 RepID=UPI003B42DE2A
MEQTVTTVDSPDDEGIASLPPSDLVQVGIPISSATGQPRRAKWMAVSNVLLYAASLVSAAALGWSWWQAIHMPTFAHSSTLVELWQPRPGGWRSVVAVTLVFVIGAAMMAAPAVAAFNSWNGHRWSRIAGIVAVLIGALGWFLFPWALAAPALSILGTLLLWLEPVNRYFRHWERFREGDPSPVVHDDNVVYGPLPRYL